MLSVYTRHYPPCKRKNAHYRRCKCPKWIQETTDAGEFIRRSAKTRSWAKAEKLIRKLEKDPDLAPAQAAPPAPLPPKLQEAKPAPRQKRIEIEEAVETFLKDAAARGLKEPSQQKLRNLCRRQLLGWAKRECLVYLDELTTANLTSFRNEWTDGVLARKKKHERMISFFKFCVDCGWLQKNPSAAMRRVKVDPVPTDYFPPEEFKKILEATKQYRDPDYEEVHNHATRLRILVLLMRWSGLRISDAVTLERSRLTGNNLFLYQAKTGLSPQNRP